MKLYNMAIKKYSYYKYIYSDWKQPVLTANGVLGGDKFAVHGTSYMANGAPFKCFTNNIKDGCYQDNLTDLSKYSYITYNPQAMNITKWLFYYTSAPTGNTDMDCPIQGIVYACNDNKSWVKVGAWNVPTTDNQYKTIDLSSNKGYYKYYKLQPTKYVGAENDPSMSHMIITATQRFLAPSIEDDHDYKVSVGYNYMLETKNNQHKAYIIRGGQ